MNNLMIKYQKELDAYYDKCLNDTRAHATWGNIKNWLRKGPEYLCDMSDDIQKIQYATGYKDEDLISDDDWSIISDNTKWWLVRIYLQEAQP